MPSPIRACIQYVPCPLAVPSLSECHKKVTIGSFSYEVLLNIFRYYLNASPQYWPRLVHICRKWRRIVFDSQRALHLRLFCTRGMPVLKALDCWPALRIVVHHGARRASAPYPLAPEDEDNVVAALKHSDRVSSISLAVTSSLLEKLSTIERPFSELESLVLRPQVGTWMTLPSTFRWGRRLRALRLTKLNIPALPELLSLSTSLLELRLLKIPQYFSLDTFAHALSGMTQLRTLSLQFRSFTPCPDSLGLLPQSRERAVLPALTRLKYQGTSEYLDNLMARIDAPCLNVVQITFFCRSLMRALQLGRFIDRIQAQNSRAEILFSARAITITFTPPENPTRLELQVSGDSLPQQLSCMAQILKTSPAFLLGVGHLCIRELHPSSAPDYIDRTRWWELFRTFRGIKWVQIVAGQHSRNIVLALRLRKCEAAFPALHKLCIGGPLRDCSPFRKAVESFIHSRRLSGHNIGVEYEREINELRRSGPFSEKVTIDPLPDDVLLHIFRLNLHTSPQFWPTLTHVSRRWRHIVRTSPLGLGLRLYCTYGTHVSKALDCWPALPIAVQYGGEAPFNPPVPEDEDNIVAALKHSDRVSAIGLMVTTSLLDKLSAIEMPFLELEELALRSLDNVHLTLPTPWWGTRLRRLHSTRVSFPTLLESLSPSIGLVDLQLLEIPNVGYFSPEAFAIALSEMTQLETLSLHFLSFPPRRIYLDLPPHLVERAVLPALTHLKYRGTSKYLDCFAARIDAPRLGDIDITLFSQPTMDASQLSLFIDRIEMQTSHTEAELQFSEHAISISFTQPTAATRLELRISCKQLDWQLASMAQICDHFSLFTSRVEDLRIKATQLSRELTGIDHEQWLKLIHSFPCVKDFYVDDKLLSEILFELGLANEKHPTVFPSLRSLRVLELQSKVGWFTTSRLLWRPRRNVYARERSCHICHASFTKQEELKKHLVVMHAYRLLCPFCGDLEFIPKHSDLFREHLANEHAEVAHTDLLIINSALQSSSPSYSGNQVTQDNDLRASINFGAFTMLKVPNGSWHQNPPVPQTRLDAIVHFLPSPYPTRLSKLI